MTLIVDYMYQKRHIKTLLSIPRNIEVNCFKKLLECVYETVLEDSNEISDANVHLEKIDLYVW